ncbi:MAG: HEAT repeat domain-containing protein [Desulfococcaceae bacterium]
MAGFSIQKKAIDAIIVMNVAVTNIRLYPPTSAIIRNSIDRVHHILKEILAHEESVVIAVSESENNYIICGQVFSESDQKKYPPVASFFEMLLKMNVKNIAFEQNLTREEVKIFLEIVSKSPEDMEKEGGLEVITENANMSHIVMDHRVYIVVDKEQKIIANIEIRDQDIIKYVSGEKAFSADDLQKIREMAQDPDWIHQVFHAGMAYIMKQKRSKPYEKLSEVIFHMIRTLDEISDNEHREMISKKLSRSIADMDEEMLAMILTQDTDAVDEKLFSQVIDLLDEKKFEKLAFTFRRLAEKQAGERIEPGLGQPDSINLAHDFMMNSVKGKRLQQHIGKRIAMERARKEQQMQVLKAGLSSILKGDETPFLDETVMTPLPDYTEQLFLAGKSQTAEAIIMRLADGLLSDDKEIRDHVSEAISHISRMLIRQNHTEIMIRMLDHCLNWIRTEDTFSPAYERMCIQLHELAISLIEWGWFGECVPILETFNNILYGNITKVREIQELADDMIKDIARDRITDLLLNRIKSNEKSKRESATRCLTLMGESVIERLLSILQDSRDMTERVRILQVVAEIGQAPRILSEKIAKGGPWYYLRNLILMMGKVGNEDHLPMLIPLLQHEDFRVQRETLNAVFNIGGKYRGDLLLSIFDSAEERLKTAIVDMLGVLKYEKAVPVLLELLETKSFFSLKISDKLKEKACTALGRIRSEQAVPALQEIVERRGLLKKAYPENVKKAAADALIRIQSSELAVKADMEKEISISEDDTEAETAGAMEKFPEAKAPKPPSATKDASKLAGRNDDTLESSVVTMMFDAVVKYAKEKNFEKAEDMHRKLVETDSMAITEIIRAREIIEQEKKDEAEIEPDHLGIWSELYDSLTPDEANALYSAMEEAVYEADEVIFRQGERNHRLWFIRDGELKLIFKQGELESLLKIIQVGDIVGEDTFFTLSHCNMSLVSLSHVKLNFLDSSILEKWEKDFPALESKLHDYCLRLERIHDVIRGRGIERRSQKRFNMQGTVSVNIISSSGTPTGKIFKGSLSDISEGGICFSIRTSSRKKISPLLGRQLEMTFNFPLSLVQELDMGIKFPGNESGINVSVIGTVIGISYHYENDYSTHIRFETTLSDILLRGIEKILAEEGL